MTGGDPRTTGVYYDDSYDRRLLPAGTTSCSSTPLGAGVAYTEDDDRDPSRLDAGQGLPGLPRSILDMTPRPRRLLDPATLPVAPASCRPVFPHQFLKVNTVFEVVKAAGMRTAWTDKHPAYEIVNGPSGNGVDDLFTPEINSDAPARFLDPFGAPGDWTSNNFATRQYDGYKVQSVLNEIAGRDHSGRFLRPVPGVFGMNFQTISTAEKLPTSQDPRTGQVLAGGYRGDGFTPGPLLADALGWLDGQVGRLTAGIAARGLSGSTAVILSAKHGQSPTDPGDLARIDDGAVLDGLNAAWRSAGHGSDLVAHAVADDVLLVWLTTRTLQAETFAQRYLLGHPATGVTYNRADPAAPGPERTLRSSGLRAVYAGRQAATYFGVPVEESRHPDVLGLVQHGVVYTGKTTKIAEHGGDDPLDRGVPLVVSAPGGPTGVVDGRTVETTRIAPTILALLGLAPTALEAVRVQGTAPLPHF